MMAIHRGFSLWLHRGSLSWLSIKAKPHEQMLAPLHLDPINLQEASSTAHPHRRLCEHSSRPPLMPSDFFGSRDSASICTVRSSPGSNVGELSLGGGRQHLTPPALRPSTSPARSAAAGFFSPTYTPRSSSPAPPGKPARADRNRSSATHGRPPPASRSCAPGKLLRDPPAIQRLQPEVHQHPPPSASSSCPCVSPRAFLVHRSMPLVSKPTGAARLTSMASLPFALLSPQLRISPAGPYWNSLACSIPEHSCEPQPDASIKDRRAQVQTVTLPRCRLQV